MDMHAGAPFREIADHRDEVVAFERAAPARKAETRPVATPAGEGWYHDAAIAAAQQDAIDARGNLYHH